MPLAEILIGTVGPAIGKSLLKLWLKDNEIAQNVGGALIELLKTKGLNIQSQRAGRRVFEKIGDQVAESLVPLFAQAHLEENETEAVALAVADTLDHAKISARLLAQKNLEPAELTALLLASRPEVVKNFEANLGALYVRTLQEISPRIVDIAAQLPGFQVGALGEILKREDNLLQVATEILNKVREIEEASRAANPTLAYADAETKYREAVVRKLDRVELIGVDVSPASREQRLRLAYVSLPVESTMPFPSELLTHLSDLDTPLGSRSHSDLSRLLSSVFEPTALVSLAGRFETREELLAELRKGQLRTTGAAEALAPRKRLLIRGPAGSGKTTLLKWIAVNAAGRTFEEPLAEWNDAVPFFLPLREYVDRDPPTPKEFARHANPILADQVPEGWVLECLKTGRAILLVDSVDELPDTQRRRVREWLNDLIQLFQNVRVVVTSRPSAVEEGWLGSEAFDDATLLPMTLPDIYRFIDHWHEAVRAEVPNPQQQSLLDDLKDDLKGQVRDKPAIRALATNPLLCAALCALHRERNQQVPSDRIELYGACCHMLIERRGKDQGLAVETKYLPNLTYRQKLALLQDLAYWMMQNGHAEVSIEDADRRLEKMLQNMPGLQNTDVREVRQLLVERSGLLREPRVGYVDFLHRTFQEFLVAQAAAEEGDIGFLIDHATNDRWRETIILAAGLASPKDRVKLIEGLLQRGDAEFEVRHALYLLAVACLETAVSLSQEMQDAVRQRLETVIPPKNREEAAAFAQAGELAVPFLKRDKIVYDEESSAACVRALALISGEMALHALKSYRDETRGRVVQELFDAANSFDRAAYFQEVLADLKVEELSLRGLPSFDGFHLLRRLRVLDVTDSPQISDLSPLGQLTSLVQLGLERLEQLSALNPLPALPNLTALQLAGMSQVSDLSQLAALPNLTWLRLWDLPQVSDLSQLAALPNLTTLQLSEMSQVSDLRPLAALPNLTSLRLSGMSHLSDLSQLAALPNLTSLELARMPQVSDLDQLAALPNLTTLELWEVSQVSNLGQLAAIPHLIWLRLRNMSQVSDLSQLPALPDLASLHLWDMSQLSDLSELTALPNLTSLELGRMSRVNDLSQLAALPQLTLLQLSDMSQVSDLSHLAALPNLTSLQLWSMPQVSDLSQLAALPNLTWLRLWDLPQVSDLSQLAALPNLTTLQLSEMSQVSDLRPLAALPNLTSLRLSGMSHLSDLSQLAALPNLTSLELWSMSQVSDLDQLAALPNLTLLQLERMLQVSDLRPLAALPKLTSLQLRWMLQVSDLSQLAALPNLTSLQLVRMSQVRDLRQLAALPKLTSLQLVAMPHVSDLSPLLELPNLVELQLEGMPQVTKQTELFGDRVKIIRRR